MQFEFATILVFILVGAAFVLIGLLTRRLLGPKPPPDANKLASYECGERPVGSAWFNFNPRFYVVALIFVIFEVEVALIYPVVVALRDWDAAGQGWIAFGEIFAFVALLALGLAYVWKKGDLAWVKRIRAHEAAPAAPVEAEPLPALAPVAPASPGLASTLAPESVPEPLAGE